LRKLSEAFMVQSSSGGEKDPQDGGPDYSDIKKRLSSLEGKLDQVKRKGVKGQGEPEDGRRGRAMGIAFRIATELVAGVVVGSLIGYFLDQWLGTAPFLLIVFLLLGIAAGLLNSVRAAQRMQKDL
jgi:ATP synthase protein I